MGEFDGEGLFRAALTIILSTLLACASACNVGQNDNSPGEKQLGAVEVPSLGPNQFLRLSGKSYVYLSSEHPQSFGLTDSIAIAARLKPTTVKPNQQIIGKWNHREYQLGFILMLKGQQIYFALSENGRYGTVFAMTSTNADIQPDRWYEIEVTYNGASKTATMYLNGEELEFTVSGSPPDRIFISDSELRIGASDPDGTYLIAYVDWVSISNTSKSIPDENIDVVILWDFNGNLKDSKGRYPLKGVRVDESNYVLDVD